MSPLLVLGLAFVRLMALPAPTVFAIKAPKVAAKASESTKASHAWTSGASPNTSINCHLVFSRGSVIGFLINTSKLTSIFRNAKF